MAIPPLGLARGAGTVRAASGTAPVVPVVDAGATRTDRLSDNRSAMARRSKPVYTIYIIELSRACTRKPCALAPLYVGQTAHSPEHRFEQHKAGGKLAAGKPYRYGRRLRYDLMKSIGTFASRTDAERAEKAVAEALERRGHRVFWG